MTPTWDKFIIPEVLETIRQNEQIGKVETW